MDAGAGLRRSTDERPASFVRGVATIVFGILALVWPDITVLVLAVVFADRLVIFGVSQVLASLRGRRPVGP